MRGDSSWKSKGNPNASICGLRATGGLSCLSLHLSFQSLPVECGRHTLAGGGIGTLLAGRLRFVLGRVRVALARASSSWPARTVSNFPTRRVHTLTISVAWGHSQRVLRQVWRISFGALERVYCLLQILHLSITTAPQELVFLAGIFWICEVKRL